MRPEMRVAIDYTNETLPRAEGVTSNEFICINMGDLSLYVTEIQLRQYLRDLKEVQLDAVEWYETHCENCAEELTKDDRCIKCENDLHNLG